MELKVPIVIASGVGGMGEYLQLINPESVGAYTLKTVTLKPKRGNPPPRLVATENYLINNIGLENPGIDSFIEKLEDGEFDWIFQKTKVILSVGGDNLREFQLMAERIKDIERKFAAVEFNFSCPNVEKGGLSIVADLDGLKNLLKSLRKTLNGVLIAKVGIEGIFVEEFARLLGKNEWNGISLINTVRSLQFVDREILRGGLSGPALKPIALRAVYEVKKAVPELFVIGGGGIGCETDAQEFFKVGADAISIGTIIYKDPKMVERIAESIGRLRS